MSNRLIQKTAQQVHQQLSDISRELLTISKSLEEQICILTEGVYDQLGEHPELGEKLANVFSKLSKHESQTLELANQITDTNSWIEAIGDER